MKHFLIAGLLAAIGAVALVGPAHAASKYCYYHPDDPDCYSQGGQDGGGGDYPSPSHHHNNGNGQYNPDDQYNQDDQGDQGDQGYQGDGGSYQDQGPGYQPVSRCQALGQGLRRYGYRHIRPLNCHGRFFGYEAFRGYHRFIVKVKANSGRIVSEIPR